MKHLILAAAAAAAVHHPAPAVLIQGFAFRPAVLTVSAGETVRFRNGDDEAHTVTAKSGAFDSGGIEGGQTWTHRFATPGRYVYYCELHPYMTATIVVVKPKGRPQ